MLKIGDKVRYKNKYLAKNSIFAPGKSRGRNFKPHRGKQRISTVLSISKGKYDWRNKRYTGDLVRLDDSYQRINVHWLSLVRRGT